MTAADRSRACTQLVRLAVVGAVCATLFASPWAAEGESVEEMITRAVRTETAKESTNAADQGVGLAGALTDFASLLTANVDSVGLDETDEALTITWNPKWFSKVSPQFRASMRTNPELYEPLAEALANAGEAEFASTLADGLDTFDDVTFSVALALNTGKLGREPTGEGSVESLPAGVTYEEIQQELRRVRAGTSQESDDSALVMDAEKIDNEQFFFRLGARERSDEVGPDVVFFSVNWEQKIGDSSWQYSVAGEYSDYDDYIFGPAGSPIADIVVPSMDQGTFKAALTGRLRPLSSGLQAPLVDLVAQYIDPEDELMNERTIASLSVTQAISDGVGLSVGVVYSSDPEFLDDVDSEWSARVGLRTRFVTGKK
ncbi:MAG: hypothetical protein GY716_10355 [bacterium]|nr:hypothetical protein [bacterium]